MRLLTISIILLLAALLTVSLSDACSISVIVWSLTSRSADPLFRFIQDGKTGYIDHAGKVVVKPAAIFNSRFNSGGEFHEGIAAVDGPRGHNFVDRSGQILFQTGFFTFDFAEGLAASEKDDSPRSGFGFLDRTGKFAVAPQFASAHGFSEGLASVSTSWAPGHTGYIDHSGNFVIAPTLSFGSNFREGLAAVILDGPCQNAGSGSCGPPEFLPIKPNATYACKYAFIDKSGKPISTLRFDEAGEFSEGMASVNIAGRWGYIDKSGQVAVEPQFDYAYAFSEGVAAVRLGDKSGFIDHSGKFAIQPQFFYASSFSEHRAIVMDQNQNGQSRYRFIDPSGKPAFPGTFEVATNFVHGLATVSNNLRRGKGTVTYINASGKPVFTYRADPNVLGR